MPLELVIYELLAFTMFFTKALKVDCKNCLVSVVSPHIPEEGAIRACLNSWPMSW